jgi:tRNA pseudouridine38-40 synthase
MPMRNIRLTLEYDGTDFAGWQIQPNCRTVQEEVTKVLRQVLQEEISINGAGRTDAGVHARGQVANFLTSSQRELRSIENALNGMLPEDIRAHDVEDAPEGFHARFSATARSYTYRIALVPIALARQYSWFLKYTLDVPSMMRVADSLVGDHDFESFCNYAAEVKHYRCIVTRSEWRSTEDGLAFDITANRFLHGMVRALVGTMVDVGRGYTSIERFTDIREARDRTRAGMAAPARGLCLETVTY